MLHIRIYLFLRSRALRTLSILVLGVLPERWKKEYGYYEERVWTRYPEAEYTFSWSTAVTVTELMIRYAGRGGAPDLVLITNALNRPNDVLLPELVVLGRHISELNGSSWVVVEPESHIPAEDLPTGAGIWMYAPFEEVVGQYVRHNQKKQAG